MHAAALATSLRFDPAGGLGGAIARAAGAVLGYRLGRGHRAAAAARFAPALFDRQAAPPLAAARAGTHGVTQSDSHHDQDRVRADAALMAAVADGDETAFARLAGEHAPRLLRFARSMLAGSPGEAEEIVQEALFRLWQQAATWQPNGRVSTWLHQVTYRLCIDALRRRRPSVSIDAVEGELEDGGIIAETRLIRIDEVRLVQAAIARLPERQRIAITLSHFQNMSQAEAALVMEIGEAAYESLLARARRRLRVLLAGEAPEGGKGGS